MPRPQSTRESRRPKMETITSPMVNKFPVEKLQQHALASERRHMREDSKKDAATLSAADYSIGRFWPELSAECVGRVVSG